MLPRKSQPDSVGFLLFMFRIDCASKNLVGATLVAEFQTRRWFVAERTVAKIYSRHSILLPSDLFVLGPTQLAF